MLIDNRGLTPTKGPWSVREQHMSSNPENRMGGLGAHGMRTTVSTFNGVSLGLPAYQKDEAGKSPLNSGLCGADQLYLQEELFLSL